jgi:HK97 family phage prohead protease
MFNLKAKPEDLKMDDYVEWNASGGKAQGKIVDIRTDGEVSSSISGYTLTGTEDDPVYVIKLVQRDSDGNDILTDQTVIHRANALRVIPDPIKSVKIFQGSEIKAVGKGMVQGYLVRFGNSQDTDLERDYFTKSTDFGMEFADGSLHKLGLYYNHGMDPVVKTKKIGYGSIKMTDFGLWYEAQLDLADEYAKMIYELAKKGKLGFSSGAASHMVDREKVGKSYEIKRWNLAEASLTPQPAESRNMASVKRYFDEQGRFIPYSREELARMDKKEYDAYMGMMFDKMNTMKNEGYDEEYDDIDDMVEGSIAVGSDPRMIAETVFEDSNLDVFKYGLKCLLMKLKYAMVSVLEYGTAEDADAILIKFHSLALDLFNKMKVDDISSEMVDESVMMMDEAMKNVKLSSVKEVEKILRDVGNISRSQSKQLANLVWNVQRDVEPSQEPQIKTTDDKAELRKSLLEKAKSFNI